MAAEEEIVFLPFEEALALVGAIQEEEDIERNNARILTVYSKDNRELCWFDFSEVMADVGQVPKEELKAAVQNYILHRIPDWARDI
jgi:hypothetical protein